MQNLLSSQRVVCKKHRSNYILSIRYFPVPMHSNAHSFSAEDWSPFQAPLQTPLRISSPQNRGLHTTPNRKRRTSKMSSAVTESDRLCFVRPPYPNTLLMLRHITQKRFDTMILAGIPKPKTLTTKEPTAMFMFMSCALFQSLISVSPYLTDEMDSTWIWVCWSDLVGRLSVWNIHAWLDGVRWKTPAFLPPFSDMQAERHEGRLEYHLAESLPKLKEQEFQTYTSTKKNSHTWSK